MSYVLQTTIELLLERANIKNDHKQGTPPISSSSITNYINTNTTNI
jgi:hypothetical protein